MSHMSITHEIISVLWMVFGVVWLIGRLRTKRAQRRASIGNRLLYGIPVVLAAFLMSSSRLPLPWLTTRILPRTTLLNWLALSLTVAGIGFAIWARFYLGQNWSSAVSIKVGHELIRTGPYAWVRHPIYSGLLLALFGTALAIGKSGNFIALGLFFAGFWIKSRLEENFMRKTFGEQYLEYCRDAGALIPRIRHNNASSERAEI